jgi:hypothetical protein
MTKTTVTRLFVGGAVAIIAGLFLVLSAVLVAYAGNAFVMTGHDVSGLRSGPFAWAMVAVMRSAHWRPSVAPSPASFHGSAHCSIQRC